MRAMKVFFSGRVPLATVSDRTKHVSKYLCLRTIYRLLISSRAFGCCADDCCVAATSAQRTTARKRGRKVRSHIETFEETEHTTSHLAGR